MISLPANHTSPICTILANRQVIIDNKYNIREERRTNCDRGRGIELVVCVRHEIVSSRDTDYEIDEETG